MLAMQYTVSLPADYDMDIIRQRIADKGHLMDRFPDLAFKVFGYACRGDAAVPSRDNLYAPFYLWRQSPGVNDFLCGPGFAALEQAFGRPQVTLWSVLHAVVTPRVATATTATREIVPITAATDLTRLQQEAMNQVRQDVEEQGALAAFTAYEPTHWTLVRFRLWSKDSILAASWPQQAYRIGYVAMGD